jgi:hypothetical protein
MKSFIDFIKDSTSPNPEKGEIGLAKKLIDKLFELEKSSGSLDEKAKLLSEFFAQLGYTVSVDDCKKILESTKNIDSIISGKMKY